MAKSNLFELGSALDGAKSWGLVEEKESLHVKILEPNKHSLYFKKEKRRGKVVTLVGEFFLLREDIENLSKELKKTLGTGGSYKDGFIELQGECEVKAKDILVKKEFRFKK
ncbi:MAG: translation initiation factor [Campylobacteraceae bacterium]